MASASATHAPKQKQQGTRPKSKQQSSQCARCIVGALSCCQEGEPVPTSPPSFRSVNESDVNKRGRDYGFAWTPHGTYARDLAHFTKLLGFTPHEAIIAATAGVAKLFMREHELGKIQPGYYADCILVNGDPMEDIEILQYHDRLDIIIINGRVHKAGRKEYLGEEEAKNGNGVKRGLDVDDETELPVVKRVMQKNY